MKQAKVLTVAERKRLLAVIANDRHSERNRLAVMLSFLAGLRVGEIAALRVSDVVDGEGRVRDQLRFIAAQRGLDLRRIGAGSPADRFGSVFRANCFGRIAAFRQTGS